MIEEYTPNLSLEDNNINYVEITDYALYITQIMQDTKLLLEEIYNYHQINRIHFYEYKKLIKKLSKTLIGTRTIYIVLSKLEHHLQ